MSANPISKANDFESPEKIIAGALADLIADDLEDEELGVHVKVTTELDPEWFLMRLAEETEYDTGVILAGITSGSISDLQERTSDTRVRVTDDVSDGVNWRNETETDFDWGGKHIPDRIVALVQGDPAKLGSLENLTLVANGKIRIQIAENVLSIEPFSDIIPGKRVWEALCSDVGSYFDLRSLASYVDAVTNYSGQAALESLGSDLHQLGILPDEHLLDDPDSIEEQLSSNIDLVNRISNMAGTDERRLNRSIRKANSESDKRSRAETVRKLREFHRGNRGILSDLEYSAVDDLLSTSLGGGGGGRAKRRNTSQYSLNSVFDEEDEELKKHAEKFTEDFKKAVEDGDNSASTSIGDDEVLYEKKGVDDDLYRFISYYVDNDIYGGVVYDADDIYDAVEQFRSLESDRYDITSNESRFDDLRRFADRKSEFEPVVEALDEYDEARDELLEYFDELYSAPLMNLLADEALLRLAQKYIDAYQEVEAELNSKYQLLNRQAGGGATSLLSEFLLLDTIAVRYADEEEDYRLVLTPVHPLHLWKYVTLAQRIREERSSIDEDDREFLLSAIERQPHVLRSIDVGSNKHLPSAYLIQDDELGSLPIYVPSEKASIGTNAEIWNHLTTKFLTAHPHASQRIRISVVDPIRPGHLLDHLIKLADDGRIQGCEVEFVYIQTDRETVLKGSEERDDVIETFGPDSGDRRFRIKISEYSSYGDYRSELDDAPKHLLLINDHSTPTVREFERDQNVTIHPLYVPKVFGYNAFDERIEMRSSPEGGIFSKYQDLINNLNTRYNDVHSASVHRLNLGEDEVSGFLESSVWVTVSAPSTNLDTLPQTQLISKEHRGDRDYGIYTKDREYFNRSLTRLFNEYPLDVDREDISDLVDSIVEYERSGLLRLVTEETESQELSKNAKGIIGAILAVKWLENEAKGPKLILSIDDPVTRKWLNLGDGSERADYLIVRFDDDDGIALDIVEVKALDNPDAQFSVDYSTTPATISGEAISEQLLPTTETIRSIFTEDDDITTGPRREALKEQIFYELMSVAVPGDEEEWVDRVNRAFSGERTPEISPNIVSIEIESGERSVEQITAITEETSQDVNLAKIPRPVLYELITGELPDIGKDDHDKKEMDEGTDEETDTSEEAIENKDSEPTSEGNEKESDEQGRTEMKDAGSQGSFGDKSEYAEQVDQLKLVLGDFGISVRDIDPEKVEVGPNVVRYKIKLGPSEKQSAIQSRSEDIARQMAFEREPIIHRLPGTEYIAMDVPRSERAVVRLDDYADHFEESSGIPVSSLPILAGVTPDGSVYKSDISDAPHMLVGGSTGSGKTVFLYSLIASLLEQKGPEQVEFALIDPKETDFLYFDSLPNLANDGVISDVQEAQDFFDWVVNKEIPRRKQLLKDKITRDIEEYNELIDDDENPIKPLVIVVDEYADLLQQLGEDADDTENDVRTIAQIARSLGIHLVISTQRPSHNAIDTDLRANLDMRVAFRLPKQQDSRILIDESGAEELAGNGDMLLKEAEQINRLQGFLVTSDDLRELVKSYR